MSCNSEGNVPTRSHFQVEHENPETRRWMANWLNRVCPVTEEGYDGRERVNLNKKIPEFCIETWKHVNEADEMNFAFDIERWQSDKPAIDVFLWLIDRMERQMFPDYSMWMEYSYHPGKSFEYTGLVMYSSNKSVNRYERYHYDELEFKRKFGYDAQDFCSSEVWAAERKLLIERFYRRY